MPNAQADLARDEAELFARQFRNWRSGIAGAIALGLAMGGLFLFLTASRTLWIWVALHVGAYVLQGLLCWRYERHTPAVGTRAYSRWRGVWIAATFVTGLITASLMWCLPPEQQALLLSAAAIALAIAIAEVSACALRSLVYATVFAQALAISAALLFHAHLPWGLPVCWLCLGLVLHFGLQIHGSGLLVIAQRRRAEELVAQVEAGQQNLLAMQHQQSVLRERQRVMEDMHDGLGSTLSSSLLLLERGDLTVPEAAAAVRECVDDLRLVVDSMEPSARDLPTLLGMLRYRLQRRIEAAGVRLRWEMTDLPPIPWLEPSLALDLLRLVQEAIANVLLHANATELELAVRTAGSDIDLLIRDNGVGFEQSAHPGSGRGMRTMQSRARRLGGNLVIHSRPGVGTLISLQIPLKRPPAAS